MTTPTPLSDDIFDWVVDHLYVVLVGLAVLLVLLSGGCSVSCHVVSQPTEQTR